MKKLSIIFLSMCLPLIGFSQGCTDPDPDQPLKVFGFIQPQFDYNIESSENTFLWNRARLGVTGNVPYDFQYYVVAELSPSFSDDGVFLLDAFISYNRYSWAKAAIGQFKSPFSLELQTPCHKLNTIYRSQVVFELAAPLRDLGFMVFGGTDTTLFKYQAAVMNGTGLKHFDDNAGKDYVGRVLFQPFKSKKILALGGSVRYGTSPAQTEGVTEEDTRFRYGLEGNFKFKDFTLQGEYIYGEDEGSYRTGGGCGDPGQLVIGSRTSEGWYFTAMYMTNFRLQPVLKYEYYDSNISEKDQFNYLTTLGINYFFNDWTRLQVNYQMVNSKNDVEAQLGTYSVDKLLSIQFQIVF